MYAIVKTGGKQYRVEEGQSLLVERLPDDDGAKVPLQPLLFVDGSTIVDGDGLSRVKVEARILSHERGPKLRIVKFKPKRGYKRRTGHRQELTRLEVTAVKLAARRSSAKEQPTPVAAEPAAIAEAPAATVEKPAATPEKPAATPEKPAARKPAARKPAARKAAAPKAAAPKAAAPKPAAPKPAAPKAAAPKPAAPEPAAPKADAATAEKPARKPAAKKPAASKPAARKPRTPKPKTEDGNGA
jgi:large subunit ribosomal protein L21